MGIHNDIDVTTLLDRPLWQLTGREFCALTQFAYANLKSNTEATRHICVGVNALAKELACSPSYIYGVIKSTRSNSADRNDYGILSDAVVSRIGKATVYDGNAARKLMGKFKLSNK